MHSIVADMTIEATWSTRGAQEPLAVGYYADRQRGSGLLLCTSDQDYHISVVGEVLARELDSKISTIVASAGVASTAVVYRDNYKPTWSPVRSVAVNGGCTRNLLEAFGEERRWPSLN